MVAELSQLTIKHLARPDPRGLCHRQCHCEATAKAEAWSSAFFWGGAESLELSSFAFFDWRASLRFWLMGSIFNKYGTYDICSISGQKRMSFSCLEKEDRAVQFHGWWFSNQKVGRRSRVVSAQDLGVWHLCRLYATGH